MLNKILKPTIILFFGIVLSISITSCQKLKDTIAVIVVKDSSGKPVPAARVVLHANPLKQNINSYNPDNYTNRSLDALIRNNLDTLYSVTGQTSSLFEADWTDDSGRVEFTLPLESILNVSVLKIDGNEEHLGANIINVKKEKSTTQVVRLLSY